MNKFNRFYYDTMEYLVESLLELPIIEMASGRSSARTKICTYAPQLFVHILNIKLKPDNQACKHWKKEVFNFCRTIIDNNRTLQKRFDAEELYEMLTESEGILNALYLYKKKWNLKTTIPVDSDIVNEVKGVISQLSWAMVSPDPLANIDEVLDKGA